VAQPLDQAIEFLELPNVVGALAPLAQAQTIKNEGASIWSLTAKSLFFMFTKRGNSWRGFFLPIDTSRLNGNHITLSSDSIVKICSIVSALRV
jgi:hypothetical protein